MACVSPFGRAHINGSNKEEKEEEQDCDGLRLGQ
jgi:hypothetical protein